MELRPSVQATAAKPAQSISQPAHLNSAALDRVPAAAPAAAPHKFSGYGLPCIKGNCYRATGVLEVNAGQRGDLLKIWRNNTFSHNQVRATITPLPKPAK